MIRLGFLCIDARRARLQNPFYIQENQLGELVDLGMFGSYHVVISNTKIYSKESLLDLKRGNLRFGVSRGKMVFFKDKGNTIITLNIYT